MHKARLIALSLICALATSACAGTGKAAKQLQDCPQPLPVPPSTLKPPDFEKRLRDELFDSAPNATPESEGSKG
jgi:hypothetical protein